MQIKRLRFLVTRVGFFIPFTWYFLLFSLIIFLGYRWLKIKSAIPDSAYRDIFTLLLKLTLLFGIIVIAFGLLSVIVSFVYFKWQQKKKVLEFRIQTQPSELSGSEQQVKIHVSPVLKPLLGFIRLRVNYDEFLFSEKFSLVKSSTNKLFNTSVDGVYQWDLPGIREYRVEKVIVYFEDLFQFFSMASSLNVNNSFHTSPVKQTIKPIQAHPRKTDETTTRIDELKKVEGELINYKNFESNDDVRRIVWKIYAKNKELVVRIPEIVDPYASHVYLFPSFHTMFNVQGNEVMEVSFLNYYKTMCWSVYEQLRGKNLDVRYVADQDVPINNSLTSENERVQYAISASRWQLQTDLKSFVKTRDASVVIISSLTDPEEVKEILEKHGHNISFLLVPLSEAIDVSNAFGWLRWLFVQEEKNKLSVYKTNWSLSLLRPKLIQNEKLLKKILREYHKSVTLSE